MDVSQRIDSSVPKRLILLSGGTKGVMNIMERDSVKFKASNFNFFKVLKIVYSPMIHLIMKIYGRTRMLT